MILTCRVRFHSIVMEVETSKLFVFHKFACQVCGLNACLAQNVFVNGEVHWKHLLVQKMDLH